MRILKFFATSAVATGVDFLLYSTLITYISPAPANFCSASAGLVVNFLLQRTYVFNARNSLQKSFVLSVVFSLFGLVLGTGIIFFLTRYTLLSSYPIVAKILTTGVIFFYNYITKKIAFAHKEGSVHTLC